MLRVLFSLVLVLVLGACSAPLVPPATLPVPSRQNLGDADLLGRMRAAWEQLENPDLGDMERTTALRDYNAALRVLVQRLRHDAHQSGKLPTYEAFEMNHQLSPHVRNFIGLHEDIIPASDVKLSA